MPILVFPVVQCISEDQGTSWVSPKLRWSARGWDHIGLRVKFRKNCRMF